MRILENIISQAVFAIHVLLVFLLLFESKISIPAYVQPIGRMHPLLLHFPIGLLVLLGLFQLLKKEVDPDSFRKIQRFTLYITVFTTSITALMGFFLSQEEGYASTMMTLHKWTGIAVSFLAYGLLLVEPLQSRNKWIFPATLSTSVVVLIIAGHLGASITHGADFVWAPLIPDEQEITDETPVYEAVIQPIMEDKCYSCHNNSKTKGDLNMASLEKIIQGGKHGPIWEAGDAGNSHMIQRVNLPMENEEHMPPEGKSQLTEKEIQVLARWIDSGADTEITIAELSQEDTLYLLAMHYIEQSLGGRVEESDYEFTFASNKKLESLNNPFRTVSPISSSSPALEAQIFVRQAYKEDYLTELAQVQDQIVSLNLTNLPIKDEDITTIAQFKHLEKLILNGTDITGTTLSTLKSCKKLRSLAISNTLVDENLENTLEELTSLENVFVWNTSIPENKLNQWKTEFPNIQFHKGYKPDEQEILTLSPPLVENERRILRPNEKVRLKNSFPGAEIRYTLDGTEPDSLKSPIYTEAIDIHTFITIKAKSVKEGWRSSETDYFSFFVDGFKPDSVKLLTDPNTEYPGRGAITLIDGKKGFAGGFKSPDWLGYKDQPFEALLDFGENPRNMEYLTISYGKNIFSYIMPPQKVELWGGDRTDKLSKLYQIVPEQPEDYQRNGILGINIPIETTYQYYKLIVQPVNKLPSWHRGKGDKGWVFIDEIFAY